MSPPTRQGTTIYGCERGHMLLVVGNHRQHQYATGRWRAAQMRRRRVASPWTLDISPVQFLDDGIKFVQPSPEVGAVYLAICDHPARVRGSCCGMEPTRVFGLPQTMRKPVEASYLLGGETAVLELLKAKWPMLYLPNWVNAGNYGALR